MKKDVTELFVGADLNTLSGLTSAEREGLLPRYEIFEEVGRGGMGVVYRGRHCELDIPVAVKVCLDSAGTERFQREAKLLAKVQSPYVVRVRDFERLDANRTLFCNGLGRRRGSG
jgi:serine/threonine protein kinase